MGGVAVSFSLVSLQKEWDSDTHYNIEESWNMLRERSQPLKVTYHMILYIWNVQNRQIHKKSSLVFASGFGGRMAVIANDYAFSSWHNKNVLKLDGGDGHTVLWMPIISEVYTFNRVNFIGGKLYLDKAIFKNCL